MCCDVGKLVSKEVVGNQMRVVGESLSLSSARRECGLVAGDQSAARLARVIIGHVGGNVHTEAVARELVVLTCTAVSLSRPSDQTRASAQLAAGQDAHQLPMRQRQSPVVSAQGL